MQPEPVMHAVRLRDTQDGTFLSVRGLSAEITIDGPLVTSRLTITFANDTQRTVEGDLVFPLPPAAALRELTVICGGRTLTGKLRPRGRAQAEYQRAVAAGHTAALAESEGEDLAHLRIAPIEPGEDVEIRLAVLSMLIPTAEGHRLIVPLTYMPRYVEDPQKQKPTERAAGERPRPLTLAARATVRVVIKHPSGRDVPTISCGSHQVTTTPEGEQTVLTVASVPLDRDLHVEVADRPRKGQPALWLRYHPDAGPDALGPTTAVAVLPPAFADEGPTVPRTVTLLVDRSGSMGGKPMAAALRAVRGCLRALGPSDRFNIIAFDNSLEALARRPLPFTDQSLMAADQFLQGINARGGTEATMAMTAALRDVQEASCTAVIEDAPRLDSAHRLRVVVFMTDGDVAGAEQVLQQAAEKLADTRLHVIGIGESVQHSLLGQLAALGGGTYTPVADDKDLEQALARLKNGIDAPLLTGVQVTIEAEGHRQTPKHIEPAGPLDLFAGRPLLIAWRGTLPVGARLILSGQQQDGQDLKLRVPLDPSLALDSDGAAPLLWALLRNRRLTYRFDSSDDATLEGLGTDFGLVNRQVALVAVHADQRDAQVQASLPVSLPLPASQAQPSPPQPGVITRTLLGQGAAMRSPAMAPTAPRSPATMTRSGSIGAAAPVAARPMAPRAPAATGAPTTLSAATPPSQITGQPAPAAELSATRSFASLTETEEASPAASDGGLLGSVKRLFGGKSKEQSQTAETRKHKKGAPPPPPPQAPVPSAGMAAPAPVLASVAASVAAPAAPQKADSRAAVSTTFSDDEAGLRALLLEQGADGLFAGDLGVTVAAVAALVGRGHTAREGLFRAELRRTLLVLRQRLAALAAADQGQAALALALLTMAHGEAAPAGLSAAVTGALTGANLRDLPALRRQITAALTAAPESLGSHALAQAICRSFQLT